MESYTVFDGRARVSLACSIQVVRDFLREPALAVENWPKSSLNFVAFSVAYNDPRLIAMQARLWTECVEDAQLAILDNSLFLDASEQIRGIASDYCLPYIRLPNNPRVFGSASHGLALNWFVVHILPSLTCEYFGFVDHDVFPLRRLALRTRRLSIGGMDGTLVQGSVNARVWWIWPGFSFWRTDLLRGIELDFLPGEILSSGLRVDTGGLNWLTLYSQAPTLGATESLRSATLPGTEFRLLGLDRDWVHTRHGSFLLSLPEHERNVFQFLEGIQGNPSR
jgi:hypothetical protein